MRSKYRHLMVEIFLRGMNGKRVAEAAGIPYYRFQREITGTMALTLEDALAIKRGLGTELPLEYLFDTAG